MSCYRVKPCPPGTDCVGFYCVSIMPWYSAGSKSDGGLSETTCTSTSQCPSGSSCVGGVCKKNPSTDATECTDVGISDGNTPSSGSGSSGGGGCSAPGCGGINKGPQDEDTGSCNGACTSYQQNFGSSAPGCSSTLEPQCKDCVNGLYVDKPADQAACFCSQFQSSPGSALSVPPKCSEEDCEKCNEDTGICETQCEGCVEVCSIPVNCSCKGTVQFEYTHKKCAEDVDADTASSVDSRNGNSPKKLSTKSCQEAAAEALNKEEFCGCPCDPVETEYEGIRDGFVPNECVGITDTESVNTKCAYCRPGASKQIDDPGYVPPVLPPGEPAPPVPQIIVYTWTKYDSCDLGDECCSECNCHSECQGRKNPAGGYYNACGADLKCTFVEEESEPAEDNCVEKTFCSNLDGAAECPAGATQVGAIADGLRDCIICDVCGAPGPDEDPRPCDSPRAINGGGECACPVVNGPNWPGDPLDRTVYVWDGSNCVPSCSTCSPIYPL